MKKSPQFRVVLVTAPTIKVARQLAKIALTNRAVACANLIPRIESHYWWKNKLEKSAEVLILFKTRASKLEDLEKLILQNHPYDTSEVVALNITSGSKRFLDWLATETTSRTPR
ncbi:MAG TPA: divalent-cation tolerance protein CutA [Verrucomicrobiae bacterium]|jgi:periplasmic divalent cation tolerance protein